MMNRAILATILLFGISSFLIFSTSSPIFAQNDDSVTSKILAGVAKEYDENDAGYDIEYYLEGELSNAVANPEKKSLNFEYVSNQVAEDELVIILPLELIEPPITVYINGEEEKNVVSLKAEEIIQLTIPLNEKSKEITLVGVKVIPEFGSAASLILVLSIISITVITLQKKFLWLRN